MRFKLASLILTFTLIFSVSFGQQSKPAPQAKQLSIEEVIQKFAAAESENKIARNNYAFTQEVDLMTVGEGGSITGRFRRISDITLDNQGKRVEKITFFPPNTATVGMTNEDLQDMGGAQYFSLGTEDLQKYNITFVTKERLDELDTYVFDVKPKTFVKGERYFEGRVWIDDQDFQVVKVAGKAVPEIDKQKFPRFEAYRENVDGRYWFPTYVHIDDVLDFKQGDIRLRGTIKFTRYKKFSTNIRVLDEGSEASHEDSKDVNTEKKSDQPATVVKKPDDKKTDEKKPEAKKPEPTPKKPPIQ